MGIPIDNKGFATFYKDYYKVIKKFAFKYGKVIENVSHRMYNTEDVEQEIWLHIFRKKDLYDESKGAVTTWLYTVCRTAAGHLLKIQGMKKRTIDEENLLRLDKSYSTSDRENNTLGDIIADDNMNVEFDIVSEVICCDYLYIIAKFIKNLKYRDKVYMLHMILGKPIRETASIFGISKQAVQPRRKKIEKDLKEYMVHNIDKVDHEQSIKLYDTIANKSAYTIIKSIDIDNESIIILKTILNRILEVSINCD